MRISGLKAKYCVDKKKDFNHFIDTKKSLHLPTMKKIKMGRPPKPAAERRNRGCCTRVSEKEEQVIHIQMKAEGLKLSMGDWIRYKLGLDTRKMKPTIKSKSKK